MKLGFFFSGETVLKLWKAFEKSLSLRLLVYFAKKKLLLENEMLQYHF